MIKWLIMQMLLKFVLTTALLGGVPLARAQAEATLEPTDMQADFQTLVSSVVEIHPNPYAHASKEALEARAADIRRAITTKLPRKAFYTLLSSYTDLLGDYHTGVSSAPLDQKRDFIEAGPQYSADFLPGVGVLELRSFIGGTPAQFEAFSAFLEKTFETLRAGGQKTLVLDLRENGGGNSNFGDLLMPYLTAQPYRMFGSTQRKISKPFLEHQKAFGATLPEAWTRTEALGLLQREDAPLRIPPKNALCFQGNLYALVGPFTASSALALATALKDFKLAEIVGEESSVNPSSFGDFTVVNLPRTGGSHTMSTSYFTRAGDFDDGRGLLPDHIISADLALGWVIRNARP